MTGLSSAKLLKKAGAFLCADLDALCGNILTISQRTKEQVEIECKYEGYLLA